MGTKNKVSNPIAEAPQESLSWSEGKEIARMAVDAINETRLFFNENIELRGRVAKYREFLETLKGRNALLRAEVEQFLILVGDGNNE